MAALLLVGRSTSSACVGAACLQIWSTADGGGALTIQYDFTKKVQTYESFCVPDKSQCLYTTIDPGFMAPPVDDTPDDSYYVLKDGTAVSVVIVSADPGVSLHVNGQKLYQPGDTALLGTMPLIHNHPSWQVVVPGDQLHDFNVSYKLTTDSTAYAESGVFTSVVTNVPPAASSPTSTPTTDPATTPTPCAGDCNSDGLVAINELMLCVNMALDNVGELACPPCDLNADGAVRIDEIMAAVHAALNGCPMPPPVTLQEIQDTIFTPRCAMPFCHDAASATGSLNLTAGSAYSQLVGVAPSTFSAARDGLLRVDPGKPGNSFLLVKVEGPPPDQGSLMPLTGLPLSADEIQMIRDWILQGAKP